MTIRLIAAITSIINLAQVVRIILLVGRSPQSYMVWIFLKTNLGRQTGSFG